MPFVMSCITGVSLAGGRLSRLCCVLATVLLLSATVARADVFNMPSGQTSLQFVTVGDQGNAADTTGYGAVAYTYELGKYDVTTAQYCQFLNAVAGTGDPYGLWNSNMATDYPNYFSVNLGISRTGTIGSYSYSLMGTGNVPVFDVTWGSAARFCNWLQNGQPTGQEGTGTTESGAYSLNGAVTNSALIAITRSSTAAYAIPTENEWYKAAYYKGGGTAAGYWLYPTRSNNPPSNALSTTGTNNANYDYSDSTNYLTRVGYYAESPGPYGTFDQGGDLDQWTGTTNGPSFQLRGGSFVFGSGDMVSSYRYNGPMQPMDHGYGVGFRVTSLALPQPVWIGGGTDHYWTTAGNWSIGAPAAGASLVFGPAGQTANTNDYPAGTQFGGITFAASAATYVLAGNRISLNGSVTNSSSAPQTLNLDIAIGSGDRVFDAAAGNVVVNGTLSGSGNLVKNGPGALLLNNAQTYTGTTLVNSGTLTLGNAAALDHSTFDSSGAGTLSFGSLTAASFGGLRGDGNLFLANSASAAVSLTVGAGGANSTFSGTLAGSGSLVKSGSGTLLLTNAQTYTGNTTIGGGILRLQSLALPPVGGSAFWLDATKLNSLLSSTGGAPSAGSKISSWTNLSNTSQAVSQAALANDPTYAAAAVGGRPALRFSQSGTGTYLLTSSFRNTSSQITVFLAGQRTANPVASAYGNDGSSYGALAFLSTANATYCDANNTQSFAFLDWWSPSGGSQATYRNGAAPAVAAVVPVGTPYVTAYIDNGSSMNLWVNGVAGAPVSSAGLSYNISVMSIGSRLGGTPSYNGLAYGAPSNFFDGYVGEVLVYNTALGDADRQTVSSYLSNKWAGSGLSQQPVADSNLLPQTTLVALSGGATLDLGGVNQTVKALTSADPSTAVTLGSGTLTVGYQQTAGSSYTFAGVISGSGSLATIGSGTLTLAGSNSYTGPTTISSGKLVVSGVLGNTVMSVNGGAALGGTGSIAGILTVASGGCIALDDGKVGTLTLSDANVLDTVLALGGTAGNAAIVNFDVGSNADRILLTAGKLQVNPGGAVLNILPLAGLGVGTYDLIDFTAGQASGLDYLTLGTATLPGGYMLELQQTPTAERLVVTVPEPGTLALLAAAGGLLSLAWRKRRTLETRSDQRYV
jgi:formylglycine-generating enzyme